MTSGDVTGRVRWALALLVLFLTPGVLFAWLQLNVSGYTWSADGTRDLGHLAKAVAGTPIEEFVMGVPVLIAAFLCLGLVRLLGPITAPSLLLLAIGAGTLVPGLIIWTFQSPPAPTDLKFIWPIAGGIGAGALALEFIVLAGIPFRLRPNGKGAGELAGKLGLGGAGILAVAMLGWLGWLVGYSTAHPCNCG
jgi:hypothetical protein